MKVIISGGGTGGHIYPAIAIADVLKKNNPTIDILFVGAHGKMEMSKVPEAGYPIVGLNIRGWQRKQYLQNFSLPFRLATSLWDAYKLLKYFQPDVVVGTGGYASAPTLYMATRQHIATLIQEQNAVAGRTNRILARYVDTVCVAYNDMITQFPAPKIVLTGNPIREGLTQLNKKREAAYAHFNLTPYKKCLLVLGGSLGAQTINESILQAADLFIEAGIQIIWATGALHFSHIHAQLTQQQQHTIKIYPFIKAIELAYAVANSVIARAGALTIAELCTAQKPVIFVPSPNVTADHQTKNVLPLIENQAALMIKEHEVSQKLVQAALQLVQSEAQQNILTHRIKAWAKPNATAAIVTEIEHLVNARNKTV